MRRTKYMPLTEIPPALANPKTHDVGALVLSIARFGFVDPALLDERTGRLVGGHGRLEAVAALKAYRDGGGGALVPIELDDTATELAHAGARQVGAAAAAEAGYALPLDLWEEVDAITGGVDPETAGEPDGITVNKSGEWCAPVTRGWASASDDEAAALLVALNRLNERGGWDMRELGPLLGALPDDLLEVAGYDATDLDEILSGVIAADAAAAEAADDAGLGDESGGLELEPEPEPVDAAPAARPPTVRNIVRNATTEVETRETVTTPPPAELRPEPRDTYREQWGLLVTCLDEADQGRALAELQHQGYRVEPVRS